MNSNLPKVYVITATCGRHTCLERSMRFFLDQDYQGDHTMLIHNNSDVSQVLHLPELPANKHIKLINIDINLGTGHKYTALGEIYNDSITFIPEDVEVISFWDDDDIFLPNHISEGIKGYLVAKSNTDIKYHGYKPMRSYYRHAEGISIAQNTLEPSIFIEAQHIKNYGFSATTSDQHHQWLSKATLLVDPLGEPTLVYNWGDRDIPTWKTSGDPGNPNNFKNYRNFSQDHGDCILVPNSKSDAEQYYSQVLNYSHL